MSSPFQSLMQWRGGVLILGENEYFTALLEKEPLVVGHVILVSKREVDNLFDLSDPELSSLLIFSKYMASAIKKVIDCQKVGIAALGLQTRQAHLHLVPISTADDLNFTRAKLHPSEESLKDLASELKNALKN